MYFLCGNYSLKTIPTFGLVSSLYVYPNSVSVFIGSDHMDAWAAQHVADADHLQIALIHSNPPVDQYDDVTCIFTEL